VGLFGRKMPTHAVYGGCVISIIRGWFHFDLSIGSPSLRQRFGGPKLIPQNPAMTSTLGCSEGKNVLAEAES
jgi:hypothetical protein